jgi:hypothetical protein
MYTNFEFAAQLIVIMLMRSQIAKCKCKFLAIKYLPTAPTSVLHPPCVPILSNDKERDRLAVRDVHSSRRIDVDCDPRVTEDLEMLPAA